MAEREDSQQSVLAIVHQETSTTGRIGAQLALRGVHVDMICPNLGAPLPDPARYDGVIVFGGPMSANDEDLPGIRAELDWLPSVLEREIPFLGVCLGAQLMVRALGGTVTPHPEGLVEIGYSWVDSRDYDTFMDDDMLHFQWHREGFSLPAGAQLLASGPVFENQAFKLENKPVYGIQFHPEVTQTIRRTWIEKASEMLELPGAQDAETQALHAEAADSKIAVWLEGFLDKWLPPSSHT